ncbi:Bacterial regulatory protein, luxR family [Planctomycetes bacterium Pan216]|uniref:Bacterial regulatory protein, luxR family n=1 Tax=Kolteria novifilia TaxID=2527975 RepID=A0A518B3U3_9BACT|nr:Bacterial regulatory protein, luxR family [Planctomycetes bacterium Pan216]
MSSRCPTYSTPILHRRGGSDKPIARRSSGKFTKTERLVLELSGNGDKAEAIASRLGRSVKTIEYNQHQIRQKLGASSQVEVQRLIRERISESVATALDTVESDIDRMIEELADVRQRLWQARRVLNQSVADAYESALELKESIDPLAEPVHGDA